MDTKTQTVTQPEIEFLLVLPEYYWEDFSLWEQASIESWIEQDEN